jgi:hypothetical protein
MIFTERFPFYIICLLFQFLAFRSIFRLLSSKTFFEIQLPLSSTPAAGDNIFIPDFLAQTRTSADLPFPIFLLFYFKTSPYLPLPHAKTFSSGICVREQSTKFVLKRLWGTGYEGQSDG